ncbi:hypothetical protein F5B17DRAFT_404232 [Nemania serpens]|nr:hypothetical protein F5B17DRAFT_404232 [Nemania serpens]
MYMQLYGDERHDTPLRMPAGRGIPSFRSPRGLRASSVLLICLLSVYAFCVCPCIYGAMVLWCSPSTIVGGCLLTCGVTSSLGPVLVRQ